MNDLERLREKIKKKKAIAVVGAGVSQATAGENSLAGWQDLMDDGFERCKSNQLLDQDELEATEIYLRGGKLIRAADTIKSALKDAGRLYEWLSETVGSLKAKNEESQRLIKAICRLGIPVITTNYDGLIEAIATTPDNNWDTFHWKKSQHIGHLLNDPEDTAVGHLHGYWREPDTVIMGNDDYGRLNESKSFQDRLRNKADSDSFVYIGYGSGLKDPNFTRLFEWLEGNFVEGGISPHFRLATYREAEELADEEPNYRKLRVVGYGSTYDDLAPFIESLVPQTKGAEQGTAPDDSERSYVSGRREAPFVISYRERIGRLGNDRLSKQAYLLQDEFAFVPPDLQEPFHPENILHRLRTCDLPPGVLLVGPGGVGKSRTLLETARRAHEGSWQVLHVVATELSDNDKLSEQLRELVSDENNKSRTLLVVDQVERAELNFHDLRERVLPDLDQDLAVLACARPSFYQKLEDKDELGLFEDGKAVIRMRPEEIPSKGIVDQIQEEVAPVATRDLGSIVDLCGDRPAIALLIADELEEHAEARHNEGKTLSRKDIGATPSNLISWLEKRFKEDELWLHRPKRRGRPKITDRLLAAAAILASAPAERSTLVSVAGDILSQSNEIDAREDGEYIVGDLEELGWLERRELGWQGSSRDARGLEVVHDVVADVLLEEVLLKKTANRNLSEERLEQLLSPCAENIVAWANMTQTLDRFLGHLREEAGTPTVQKLSEKAKMWLERNGATLAQTSLMIRKDRGYRYRSSYALSTALETGLWPDDLLIEKLVSPWLELHGSKFSLARFLLVKVLKTGYTSEKVIDKALEWFEIHILWREAPYVLRAVAGRIKGGGEQSERTVNLGIQWLGEHFKRYKKDIWNGQFIITSTLQWEEKHRADELVKWALRWLSEFGKHRRALYVIYTVFRQAPPEGEQLTKMRRYALEWLEPETRETSLEAHTVINALMENIIRNEDLEAFASKQEVAGYASSWLSVNAHTIEARYVLQPTLLWISEADDSTSLFDKVDPVKKALQWLESDKHLRVEGSELVVDALLRATGADNDEDAFDTALQHSLRWLKKHKDEERGQQVLNGVLRHPDVNSRTKRDTAESALKWLSDHSSSPKRDFIINSLLMNWESVPVSNNREVVIESAFELGRSVIQNEQEAAFTRTEANKVLAKVVRAEAKNSEEAKRLINKLGYDAGREVYCDHFDDCSTTISNSLKQLDFGSPKRIQLLEKGAGLLCDSRTYQCTGWHHLLESVLNCDELGGEDRERIVHEVNEEVSHPKTSRGISWTFAYQYILKNEADFAEDSRLVKAGVNWLKEHKNFGDKGWRHVFECMIIHPGLPADTRDQLLEIGKTWLSGDIKRKNNAYREERVHEWGEVYAAIVYCQKLSDSNAKELIQRGANWLMRNRTHEKRQKVYESAKGRARQLDTQRNVYLSMLSKATRLHQST